MATQLTFTDEFVYDDSPSGITIPVMLSYGAIDILVSAKVDTGAQVCLFSHEDGLKLGIPIEQGSTPRLTVSGARSRLSDTKLQFKPANWRFTTSSFSPNIRDSLATYLDDRAGCAIFEWPSLIMITCSI